MLTSPHPNSPTSDQAVRDLLDQRAARASHTRYTSVSYSQRSDSPSIYSRGDYSPNTQTHTHGRQWPHSGYQMSLTDQIGSCFDDDDDDDDAVTTYTRTSFDQDDQDDQLLFPAADDDISVISSLTPRPPVHPGPEPSIAGGQDEVAESSTEETEEGPRMSILGPKMRFVSKAPWELGDDGMLEEEEEPSSATDSLSVFGSKMSNWRGKDQDKSSAKGLGSTTTRSGSPGSRTFSSRKGSIGMISGLHRPQHQESQREGPYGPHLSGASQSHGAIPSTLTSSSRSSHSVTDSLSSDYVTHRQPRGPAGTASPVEPFPFPTHPFRPQNTSYSSRGESAASLRSASPPPSDRYVHPYANPDLLPEALFVPSVARPRTPGVSYDRMSDDRDRYVSPLRRSSESTTSSPPRGMGFRKASAGGLLLPAIPSRNAFGEVRESDEMSHLVPRPGARTASRPVPSSPVRSMVPYGDQPGSPLHSLITLEQARARVQNTPNQVQGPNGINGTGATSTPTSTLVAGVGLAPGVVVDNSVVRGQMQRANAPSVSPSDLSSWTGIPEQKQISHPTPCTQSSGKLIFGNSSGAGAGPDGDVIPAKTLKHKKSAFMKLFQGKDKERERDLKESASSFPDYPVRATSTPPRLPIPSDSSVPPMPSSSVRNIKRVPPPLPLSVVVTSPSFPPSGSPPQLDQEQGYTKPASPPRPRQASAPLPGSSHPPSYSSTESQRLDGSESQLLSTSGPELSKSVSSAPPTRTTFETLSLRPVSTIFSAKFPDLLSHSSPPDFTSSPAALKRLDNPSPTTPGFSDSRSNSLSTSSDFPLTPTSGSIPSPPSLGVLASEEQSSIIASLQEQIVNTRKLWQRQIWELEGQVKDLKAEVEELRNTGDCETCGLAKRERRIRAPVQNVGVVDRPRPRLGGGNVRTVFGGGSDM